MRALRRALGRGRVGEPDLHDRRAQPGLQLGSGALGNHMSVIDDHDVVGEAVGLLEVLRGEEHGRPFGDELLDDPPEVGATLRVEARGRLVEEQHFGPVHERGGEVETAAHPTAVSAHGPVGGIGEIKTLEQLDVARAQRLRIQVRELAHHPEVLVAGQVLVDGGVLTREADAFPYGLRIRTDIDAEHIGASAGSLQDGRENPHRRGLPGTVRPEEAEHAAGRHGEVDTVEGNDGTESLLEVLYNDGVVHSVPPSHG